MIRYALYRESDGFITSIITAPFDCVHPFEGMEYYLNCPVEATHIINNEPVTIIPELTIEEVKTSLVNAVQRHLDDTARTHNYDGILSLCSYATSLDVIFAIEGQAGMVWRDACWRYSYQVQEDIVAGLRTVPTPEELIAELPEMIWP